jgi:hypothetical protein
LFVATCRRSDVDEKKWRRMAGTNSTLVESPRVPAKNLFDFLSSFSSFSSEQFLSEYLFDPISLPYDEKVASADHTTPTSPAPVILKSPDDIREGNQMNQMESHLSTKILLPISQELISINSFYHKAEARHSNQTNQSNLLSVTHLRGIYTALEILWHWGIVPSLPIKISKESLPKSMLISSQLLSDLSERISERRRGDSSSPSSSPLSPLPVSLCTQINDFIEITFRTCTSSMFRGMMIERNYKRILCVCISILCHWNPQNYARSDDQGACFPHPPTHSLFFLAVIQRIRLSCQNLLNGLILDPIVSPEKGVLDQVPEQNFDIDRSTTIEGLRYVSVVGTPVMQQIVGSLLTMILIQPDGLRATLSVYLSGRHTRTHPVSI